MVIERETLYVRFGSYVPYAYGCWTLLTVNLSWMYFTVLRILLAKAVNHILAQYNK